MAAFELSIVPVVEKSVSATCINRKYIQVQVHVHTLTNNNVNIHVVYVNKMSPYSNSNYLSSTISNYCLTLHTNYVVN